MGFPTSHKYYPNSCANSRMHHLKSQFHQSCSYISHPKYSSKNLTPPRPILDITRNSSMGFPTSHKYYPNSCANSRLHHFKSQFHQSCSYILHPKYFSKKFDTTHTNIRDYYKVFYGTLMSFYVT